MAQVRAIVAGKTGYPEDMLDLDLDLEADLGVDTVKQAETFAAIRETFDIPRQENLQAPRFTDWPTSSASSTYAARPGRRRCTGGPTAAISGSPAAVARKR